MYIYSDGSGLTDSGIGAYSAIILSTKYPELSCTSVVGGGTAMSTTRAELTAIIEGLYKVHTALVGTSTKKPSVLVVSDRQDLVGIINNIFTRKQNKDLWARYDWLTTNLEVSGKYVKRETNITQSMADKLASGFRIVVQEFVACQQNVNHLAKI